MNKKQRIISAGNKNAWKGSRCLTVAAAIALLDIAVQETVDRLPDSCFPAAVSPELELDRVRNSGTAFEYLSDRPEKALMLSAAAEGFAATGLLFAAMGKRTGNQRTSEQLKGLGTALLAGGGFANLYSRASRGYVTDYLHIKKGRLSNIVFNLSDVAAACGALLALLVTVHGQYDRA